LQAPPKLSTDIKVTRGAAPGAGFAETAESPASSGVQAANTGSRLSAAKQQSEEIVAIGSASEATVSKADLFSLLSVRLSALVDYEAIAVYCPQGDILATEFASGESFRLLSSLKIPLGKGLSGWVAQNHKAIVNGNPSVEPGYLNEKEATLHLALAVPIEGPQGVAAVLALYRAGQNAFTADDLRVVEAIGGGLGNAIAAAQKVKATGAGA
jgi:GAF domain-containing protein